MFADDICVSCPSISGLQCLLNICGDNAAEHEITFIAAKQLVFLFPPKSINTLLPLHVARNFDRGGWQTTKSQHLII